MILSAKRGGGLAIAHECHFIQAEAIDAALRLAVNVSIEQVNRAKLEVKIERRGDPWSDDCEFKGEKWEGR